MNNNDLPLKISSILGLQDLLLPNKPGAVKSDNLDWGTTVSGYINAVNPGYFNTGGYCYRQMWGKLVIVTIKNLFIDAGDSYVPVLTGLPAPAYGGVCVLSGGGKSIKLELSSGGQLYRLGESDPTAAYCGQMIYLAK